MLAEATGRTRRIGRELFESIGRTPPRWDDAILEWAMANPELKTRLLHFVDVLPTLSTAGDVAAHIEHYFADIPDAPEPIRLAARWAARWNAPAALAARVGAARMAGRFIAGETAAQVLRSVARMRRAGLAFTLDWLGEATLTEPEADAYLQQYLRLIEHLGPAIEGWPGNPLLDSSPRLNLSLKASALYSQFDPIDPEGAFRGVSGRLREIFRAAQRSHTLINLDMEQYAYKDLTIHIFQRLLMEPEFRRWPGAGIAIQAYLRDAEADLRALDAWVVERGTPIWVRLVKGAYWDYETVVAGQSHWPVPVYMHKAESDASFERCTEFLMRSRSRLRPAIASHNVRSIAHALALAEEFGAEKGEYEMQVLYGMAGPIQRALAARGERVRVYTPFGKLLPGMAYLVRRLLENTSNSSFLRARFVEGVDTESLLAEPVTQAHQERLISAPRGFSNEPLSDFSRPEIRAAFSQALGSVRREFGQDYPVWIGGQSGVTGPWIESRNPADTAELLGRVSKAGARHADDAVAAALAALPAWRAVPIPRRADALFSLAAKMRARRWELAAWILFETGKQWREADADVAEAIDFCEYYAHEMLALEAPRQRHLPGEENAYFYMPRGVTVVIAPWNFPLAILAGMTAAPLVAGNTVILKPAEQSSVTGAKFAELLRELDLPPGTVNFVPGLGEEVGRRLVEHPDVAAITFTGSVAVGTLINRAAAEQRPGQRHVKRVLAEMGGKNAILIDNDADLDEAVRGVVASAFSYQGQKCSACSRAIVLPRAHDAFVSRLKEAVASLSIGPPENPGNAIGPVIDRDAWTRLRAAIEQGRGEATLLIGGGVDGSRGHFLAPHVFVDVDPRSMLGQTELFGPVLSVIRARDLDGALAIANDVDYALTGGCYSRDPATLARVKDAFLVGNLYLNRKITGALVDVQPFGGFKMSGIGAKAGGPDYLKQFLVPRTVTENTLRRGFAPDLD